MNIPIRLDYESPLFSKSPKLTLFANTANNRMSNLPALWGWYEFGDREYN